jgi:hypothetical protein
LPIVGVGLDDGVVPVIPAGVVIEPVVGVLFMPVLPAAPVFGAGIVAPVGVVGVVGAVGVVWPGVCIMLSLPQPVNAAMMQSVDSVESLVIMESSNFELTHISPKTALPLRNPADTHVPSSNRVCLSVESCDSSEVWT